MKDRFDQRTYESISNKEENKIQKSNS